MRSWLWFAAAASFLACQAKVKVKTTGGSPAPAKEEETETPPAEETPPAPTVSKAEAVTINDGFAASRERLQSRTPIVLDVKPSLVEPGDRFELINETTGATLIEDQMLGLQGGSNLAPFDVTIRLYPLDPDYADRFTYGANKLRLLVKDEAAPRESRTTFDRRDFALLVPAGGSFDAGVQRAEGIELMPGGFGQPSVTNGKRVLTVDPISMLSR